ncbi:helix-turn-helix domain-containing protein [Lysinibacillus irui]|uniref:Helix-turn-helix domain-containing protein n=1 Tax=Lysinibacillus irui TaxID=2998077 RepID=A0ABU5NLN0_9BACI|nr:helix-turn-helix domain-containing protein [Lysinibacillus irui]MEA0555159.1 helix-turn-helix domain-containing protein [Lysinibacillus irui]MEA0976874.1 helix-turn-helix domain-containing protein [Lysinibacillus irui]MEA1043028.1 helix-turn-helix domain-containing protein [Lysinibacillus irui]
MRLIVDRLQQFLSDFCNLSQFQVWKNINEDRFSLVISQGMEEQLAPSHDKKNIDVYEYQFQFHEKRQLVLRLHRALSATENQAIETLLHAYYLELMLEKEQFIRDKMMESIREISVLNDIHTLLTKILENALSVIPSADFGVLWMYDESEAALVPKAWVGGPGEDIKNMRMKVGEGIIGKTFKDNQSMILNSYTDVLKASSSVTEENLRHLLNAYTFEYLQSVIAVPIAVEEQTLCVVIIYQNGENALLTIEDKQLLESFSDQVSIALTNSKLFQNLKLQNELLLQRDQIHHTFMKLSLQNAGMQVIVNEIRHMLNLRLVIMDLMDDSIYASPRHWIEKGDLFRFVHLTETPAFYSLEVENEQVDYYIQPIIGVGQILGLLLIEINEQKLESIHKLIIEQASSIIALELIRKQTIVDSFYKKTHDLFHDFLTSKDPGQLMKKGEELGIQSNANYAVVLIQLSTGTDIQAMDMQVHLLISEIKKHFQDHAPIVFGFGHKITVLCQFKRIGNELLHLVQQFQGSWEKVKNNSLKIGVGTLYSGMDQIAKSYNEADKALSFLMTRQRWGIMHYQEIGVNRLFIHQTQEELLGFVNEVFLPLRNEKTKHHLLEETLLMYIKQNGSVRETAKQLHIHVNTLYQRLRKIEEKLTISFQNADDVLRLQLACYLKGMVH